MAILTTNEIQILEKLFVDNGWTTEDVNNLSNHEDIISKMLPIVRDEAELSLNHFVDSNCRPKTTSYLEIIIAHKRTGVIQWEPDTVQVVSMEDLLTSTKGVQIDNKQAWFDLFELHKNSRVANACILDYYLNYPELIPEEWKNLKKIAFLGTFYNCCEGDNCCHVRYLCFEDSKWREDHYQFEPGWSLDEFSKENHVAVLKEDMKYKPTGAPLEIPDDEKEAWKMFYLDVFNLSVDFSKIDFPVAIPNYATPIMVPKGITRRVIWKKLKESFQCADYVHSHNKFTENESTRNTRDRNYIVLLRDSLDTSLISKDNSIEKVCGEDYNGATIEELMLYSLFYYWRNGVRWKSSIGGMKIVAYKSEHDVSYRLVLGWYQHTLVLANRSIKDQIKRTIPIDVLESKIVV